MNQLSRGALLQNAAVLLGLTGAAITQPILSLLGDNPTFFTANGAGTGELLGFALWIALAPTLALLLAEIIAYALSPRLGSALHTTTVALLSSALGLLLARALGLEHAAGAAAFAACCGIGLALIEARSRGARAFLRWLALGPLVSVALFLLSSPAAALLWQRNVAVSSGVHVGRPAPLVVVVFDELSLASLLNTQRSINPLRYPNFARLAEQATWFRNATAVAPGTDRSIPSLLTGRLPSRDRELAALSGTDNLFTLLADRYRIDATEPITQLCPRQLCRRQSQTLDQRLGLFLDTAIAYGHLLLPPAWKAGLAPIDQGWGNFTGRELEFASAAQRHRKHFGPARYQAERWHAAVSRIVPGDSPQLTFIHSLLPHIPWQLTPSGVQYTTAPEVPGWTRTAKRWTADALLVAQGYERHLLQLGYVDSLLGELMQQLHREALWNDALLVVTADHGVAFVPGESRRHPNRAELLDAIYRIPLFIKLPGQALGAVRDDAVLLTDVLPTIVEALEIELPSDWKVTGRSLLSPSPGTGERPVVARSGPERMSADIDGLWQLVERRASLINPDGDWSQRLSNSEASRWIGHSVSSLDITPLAQTFELARESPLRSVDLSADFLPLLVEGRIAQPLPKLAPGHLLVTLGEVVAGLGVLSPAQKGVHSFSAMLEERYLRQGVNRIELLLPLGAPKAKRYGRVQLQEPGHTLEGVLKAGSGTIVLASGARLPLIAHSDRYRVDASYPVDLNLPLLSGWAGDLKEEVVPSRVLLYSGKTLLAGVTPDVERADRAERYGEGLRVSGYEILLPGGNTPPADELRVVALFGDVAVLGRLR